MDTITSKNGSPAIFKEMQPKGFHYLLSLSIMDSEPIQESIMSRWLMPSFLCLVACSLACKPEEEKKSTQPQPVPGPTIIAGGNNQGNQGGGGFNQGGNGGGLPTSSPQVFPSFNTGGGGSFGGQGPGKFFPDFESSTQFFSQMTDFATGTSPHGKIKVYYSTNIQQGLNQANYTVPMGTTAIALFDNDNKAGVDGYVIMVKEDQNYDSANGNWSYELRDKWGDTVAGQSGRVASCSQCHNGFQATDRLASTKRVGTGGSASNGGGNGPGAFVTDYATSPNFYSRMAQPAAGRSPHGRVRIFYSTNMHSVLDPERNFTEAPVGSVAIKRYEMTNSVNDRCQPNPGLAVMIKEAAAQGSATRGWRFEIRSATGALIPNCDTTIRSCQQCHQQGGQTDWLRGTLIKN